MAGKYLNIDPPEGLIFKPDDQLSYVKVFVTVDWTDFAFLRQHWRSSNEDRLRESTTIPTEDDATGSDSSDSEDDVGGSGNDAVLGSTDWADIRIAIKGGRPAPLSR